VAVLAELWRFLEQKFEKSEKMIKLKKWKKVKKMAVDGWRVAVAG
jgi:hypothetical protein